MPETPEQRGQGRGHAHGRRGAVREIRGRPTRQPTGPQAPAAVPVRGQRRSDERADAWSEANPEGRWRSYAYEDLLTRDKLSLDLFWIKDKSLTDTDSLPAPYVLATEIADDLEAALEMFTKIAAKLEKTRGTKP